jgi:hypothetical protein
MRFSPVVLALGALVVFQSTYADAQRGGGRGRDEQQDEDDAKRRKTDEEFSIANLNLPKLRNAGPCPYVKVLYDASRIVEFEGGKESMTAVGFTGEIQKVASICAYRANDPIQIKMRVLFEFGRGPKAVGGHKNYRYWVAVTDRNRSVLAKEYFDLPVTFASGHDREIITQDINDIVIPRAEAKVSGANFEVLIGFDVTPEMADFNRQGKRFRANAGEGASGP